MLQHVSFYEIHLKTYFSRTAHKNKENNSSVLSGGLNTDEDTIDLLADLIQENEQGTVQNLQLEIDKKRTRGKITDYFELMGHETVWCSIRRLTYDRILFVPRKKIRRRENEGESEDESRHFLVVFKWVTIY